jgi:amino acid transporter
MAEKAEDAAPAAGRLSCLQLAVVAYAFNCGGAYGIESAVSQGGAFFCVLFLCVFGLLWALPQALMTAELSTAFPKNGSSLYWIESGLGRRWALVAAVCLNLGQALDMAVYPGLLTSYLGVLWPAVAADARVAFGVQAGVVLAQAAFNVLGLEVLTSVSYATMACALFPFFALPVAAAVQRRSFDLGAAGPAATPNGLRSDQAVFAATMLWVFRKYAIRKNKTYPFIFLTHTSPLCLGQLVPPPSTEGWSSVGSLAADVRDPRRSYPRAMLLLVAATVATYAVPIVYGVALEPDLTQWGEGFFGDLSQSVAPWLGACMALGGVASNFAAGLNSFAMYSRFLQATAIERYVPVAALGRDDTTRFGTPVYAIALLTVSTLALTNLDFDALLGVDTLFNAASVVLVSASFLRLRIVQPALARPYSVPGGTAVAAAAAGSTFALCGVSVVVAALSSWASVLIVGGVAAAAYAAGWWREGRSGGGAASFELSASRAAADAPNSPSAAGIFAMAAMSPSAASPSERTSLLGRVGRAYSLAAAANP